MVAAGDSVMSLRDLTQDPAPAKTAAPSKAKETGEFSGISASGSFQADTVDLKYVIHTNAAG